MCQEKDTALFLLHQQLSDESRRSDVMRLYLTWPWALHKSWWSTWKVMGAAYDTCYGWAGWSPCGMCLATWPAPRKHRSQHWSDVIQAYQAHTTWIRGDLSDIYWDGCDVLKILAGFPSKPAANDLEGGEMKWGVLPTGQPARKKEQIENPKLCLHLHPIISKHLCPITEIASCLRMGWTTPWASWNPGRGSRDASTNNVCGECHLTLSTNDKRYFCDMQCLLITN